ncbi:MAG TPA: SpoIIE family protein phosphatase [Verrucomicrobiae bacterium]|jgi:serine phosphatase RsbU (regulator of sigma subunit)/anti-sigma regulatory factor (Ser/Thr protein kinase)|nr:SpoIIE family protein phosphatase [Verrucomicrobiae bacterium]
MQGNCSRPAALRLTIPCELPAVSTAIKSARQFLAEQGWPADELIMFDHALVEACNNAIKYVGDEGREQPVGIEVSSDAEQVEFRVRDHTPGFDWPKKMELPRPDSENGRGLYLIHSLMDHAGYLRGQSENILVMRKRRASPIAAAPPSTNTSQIRRIAEQERMITDMVEELSSCYESLSAIFRYSTDAGRNGSLTEFAQRLLVDLLQIVGGEWFVLRLVPHNSSRMVVFAASEPAQEWKQIFLPPAGHPATSLEMKAALNRERVWFDHEEKTPAHEPLARARPGTAGVVYPILLGEQLIGTLALGKTPPRAVSIVRGQSVFTVAQTNVVNMFADFLAIQIANARFQEEQVSRRLVTHELEIAKNIQRSLLLTALPQLPGFTLAAFCRSAREVGGDFYDVLRINEHSALLVIADVMGKGIPAAMFAAILRSLLRASPELTPQPAALLARVNRLLFPELSGVDMFITAQLAFVDAKERKLVTASAGHCPLAVADKYGVKTFSPEGMPLGIFADTEFQDEIVDLPPDCRVMLYTDGLSDACDVKREYFSHERLMKWLHDSTAKPRSAEQLKNALLHELDQHQLNAGLNDDQTFIIMAG